jgi:hypothetical protein
MARKKRYLQKRYLQKMQCNLCRMQTYLEPWCKKCAYNIGVCVKPRGAIGLSLYATRRLPEGFTLPYGGELLTSDIVAARYNQCTGPYLAADRDASGRRSWAAMAAHSSRPNAVLTAVGSHVILHVTKPIRSRECITIDYGTEYWHSLQKHDTVGLWDYLQTQTFPPDVVREEKDRKKNHKGDQKITMPFFKLYDEQHDSTAIELLDYTNRTQLKKHHGSVRSVAYRTGLPVSTVHRWRTQLKKPSKTHRAVNTKKTR